MKNDLAPFFSPKGVAIIGASTDPNKLSHGILENMKRYGFEGMIYPVNPKAEEILDLRVYPDVASVPDPVELAVVVLPAPITPAVMQACGERGIKAVTIISGGFREVGKQGVALEAECRQIAQSYGMRVIGPNCVGTMDLFTGLNTTFIEGIPAKGPIGFLSQSGAVCGGVVDYIADKGIGFSHIASLGNEMDVDETDMIAFFGDHPQVKVIAAYVEGIQDGQKFIDVASRISREKPIVLLKAGRTEAGAKAVSSHTGSLAGSYSAYQAAFEQAGVIEVDTIHDLFNIAWSLSCQPLPNGNKVVILTNSGGPAALASDALASNGFELAEISTEKQTMLAEKLNPSAQTQNPVDMLGGAAPEEFAHGLSTLSDEPDVDVFIPMLVPQSLVNPADVARAIIDNTKDSTKTILACMVGERSLNEARAVFHQNQIPMSIFPEVPGRVLGAMARYQAWLDEIDTNSFKFDRVDRNAVSQMLDASATNTLGEAETRPLLAAYGFPLVSGRVAQDVDDAIAIADDLGYPVVIKIVSPQILHKSDMGGIALDIKSPEVVRTSIIEMTQRIKSTAPDSEIDGFLVQKMAPEGLEVIIGMRRDPTFGPLMMFGLGGVYVELFKDVGFGIAPLSPGRAYQMVESTRAGRLLKGFRGSPVYDEKAVVQAIGRLSQLALDHPEISEVEINPLLVLPDEQGALALDARMILSDA